MAPVFASWPNHIADPPKADRGWVGARENLRLNKRKDVARNPLLLACEQKERGHPLQTDALSSSSLTLSHRHRIAPWRGQIFRRIAASGHPSVLVTLQDLFADGLFDLRDGLFPLTCLRLSVHQGEDDVAVHPVIQLLHKA